jgi:signal transduction histidine kinase
MSRHLSPSDHATAAVDQPEIGRMFRRISLARQFLLGSLLALVVVVAAVGSQISRSIESGIVQRTAHLAAAYFQSMLERRLQHADATGALDDETQQLLSDIFVHGALASHVVRFKLWSPDGRIRYSSDPTQIGARFALHDHHALALLGQLTAAITLLDGPDNGPEREQWSRLIEIYVPLFKPGTREVTAVAEFYHEVDSVQAEILHEQRLSWASLVLGAGMLYAILCLVVLGGSRTIDRQRTELARQVKALEQLLEDNRQVHRRLQEAGVEATALSESALRRAAADLHDGPLQELAWLLLQIEPPDARGVAPGETQEGDAAPWHDGLHRAMRQMREIARGLAAPAVAHLPLCEVLRRAALGLPRNGLPEPGLDLDPELQGASEAVKLTAYRAVQEAFANVYKHASGQTPCLCARKVHGQALIEVTDQGPGFDPTHPVPESHFGLAFLAERVTLVGGRVDITSAPGKGTQLAIWLPLDRPGERA